MLASVVHLESRHSNTVFDKLSFSTYAGRRNSTTKGSVDFRWSEASKAQAYNDILILDDVRCPRLLEKVCQRHFLQVVARSNGWNLE